MKKLFTRRDLMRLAGLTLSDANSWPKKGIISINNTTGTGKDRIYTFQNLIEASLAKRLSRFLNLDCIVKINNHFRDFIFSSYLESILEDTEKLERSLTLYVYMDDSGKIVTYTLNDNLYGVNPFVCISVNLGQIVSNLTLKINQNIPFNN